MKPSVPIPPSEITPYHLYLSRREFLKAAGIVSAGALLAAACGTRSSAGVEGLATPAATSISARTDELGDPLNTYEEITTYNNYYEFTTDKERVARLAENFKTSPWEVEVGGLVHKPQTFGLEDLLKKFSQEERIYRMRCVEAWSMVIPWNGFSLASLLEAVEPTSEAKYVRFEAVYDPDAMPGQKSKFYPWPYTEGLRLDEAMHELTIMATGLYGTPLPPQSGAPLRLVVPWKYGFKSIKGVVKIELTKFPPETLWNIVAPQEYGFYANVNPQVDHPRWSQATERRIGEAHRRPTLMFNGYEEEVASLYEGMDLRRDF